MTENISDLLTKHVCELDDATPDNPFDVEVNEYITLAATKQQDKVELLFTVFLDDRFDSHDDLLRAALSACFFEQAQNMALKTGMIEEHLIFLVTIPSSEVEPSSLYHTYEMAVKIISQVISSTAEQAM